MVVVIECDIRTAAKLPADVGKRHRLPMVLQQLSRNNNRSCTFDYSSEGTLVGSSNKFSDLVILPALTRIAQLDLLDHAQLCPTTPAANCLWHGDLSAMLPGKQDHISNANSG